LTIHPVSLCGSGDGKIRCIISCCVRDGILRGDCERPTPPIRPIISSAIIPFTDFDAGEYSYSIGFVIEHADSAYSLGDMHKSPVKLFDDIK
jgi:hypothetical protein